MLWVLWSAWSHFSSTCLPLHWNVCPHDFVLIALVRVISHLSPTCTCLPLCLLLHPRFFACVILLPLVSTCLHSHLSPSPLWMLLSAWLRICLPQLSPTTLRVLCPHDFTLVSNLSPSTLCSAWHDFTLVSHLSTLASSTTSTNHLQPTLTFNLSLLAQTWNTMKFDWSRNKLFGVNAGIFCTDFHDVILAILECRDILLVFLMPSWVFCLNSSLFNTPGPCLLAVHSRSTTLATACDVRWTFKQSSDFERRFLPPGPGACAGCKWTGRVGYNSGLSFPVGCYALLRGTKRPSSQNVV